MGKLLNFLAGWKTLLVFVSVLLDAALNNAQAVTWLAGLLGLTEVQLAAIAGIILRLVTNTPIGGAEK